MARSRSSGRIRLQAITVALVGLMVTGFPTGSAGGPARPPAVTPAVYASQLQATASRLQAALTAIGSAPPLAPLAPQVDSATSAVRDAQVRLAAVTPPPHDAADSRELVSALDQLASQLSGLGDEVRSQDLCTASSVMATLSTLPAADARGGQAMIATLRHRLIRIPARLIHHAGALDLRLPPGHHLLKQVLARLRALPATS